MSACGSCGRTIGATMTDGHESAPSACSVAHSNFMRESVWGCEPLYRSAYKCFKGVGKKHSVQNYKLHVVANTVKLARAHRTGTYKAKPPKIVPIEYPKKRTAMSIALPDRISQRSLNDLSLYPQATRHFIMDNCACQKGKGTDFARERMKAILRKAYVTYGTNDFKIVEVDVKGYYDNMDHAVISKMFMEMVDPWTAKQANEILDKQYSGVTGYNPGSQTVQIAGIAFLNKSDHHMKEVVRLRLYIRYMDDERILARDDAGAELILREVKSEAEKVKLTLHPKKTKVVSAKDGTVFLGFLFRVTDTGRVLVSCDPAKVKANRRKMRRLANKIKRGESDPDVLSESYGCIRAHISRGNTYGIRRRMDALYHQLEGEIQNDKSEKTVLGSDGEATDSHLQENNDRV